MKNKTLKQLVSIAFLIASGTALADSAPSTGAANTTASNPSGPTTFDIKVTGQIIPGACTPNVGNSGVVQMNPNIKSLSPNAVTQTAVQSIPIRIDCGGTNTKIALSAQDARAGSAYDSGWHTLFSDNTSSTWNFGLGSSGNNRQIGDFQFQLANFTADNIAVFPVVSTDNGVGWADHSSGNDAMRLDPSGKVWMSWASTSGGVPVAAKVFSGIVNVAAVIAPASKLDTTQAITLDGDAVVTIHYL
ncbi:DUF1120 domain-containing protein [Burkholderia cepacia]|uniref:DUF1120 domain-containing protein n=1 Tax=Burkholderia cepacia TaxID=292 RepID=UPI002ABDC779|nr:DUF1120 domain-containing protein [Burkholderia cepacia]